MFKNSGRKIMGLVKFLFGLNVVVGLLGGALGAIYVERMTRWGWGLAIVCGVVAALLYCLIAYLTLLWAYSYGELVQSNVDQKELLEKLLLKAERPAPVVHREPAASPRVKPDPDDVYGYEPARPVQREYAKPAVEMNPAYMGGAVLRPTPVVPAKSVVPPQPVSVSAAEPIAVPTPVPATEPIAVPTPVPATEPIAVPTPVPATEPIAQSPMPSVIYCNKCGAKHTPDAQNCRYCGNPLR